MLRQMRAQDEYGNPIPFSVEFVKCDRLRELGGELAVYENCVLNDMVRLNSGKRQSFKPRRNQSKLPSKRFKKLYFRTPEGKIKSFHIILVQKFNGEKVIP